MARGYEGPLYAEVSPRSFSVRVRKGSKLNQIRFRRLNSQQLERTAISASRKRTSANAMKKLRSSMATLELRGGLVLRVGLSAEPVDGVIGYKAQKHADSSRCGPHWRLHIADYWVDRSGRGATKG